MSSNTLFYLGGILWLVGTCSTIVGALLMLWAAVWG